MATIDTVATNGAFIPYTNPGLRNANVFHKT